MKKESRKKYYVITGLAILLLFMIKIVFEKGEVLGEIIAK